MFFVAIKSIFNIIFPVLATKKIMFYFRSARYIVILLWWKRLVSGTCVSALYHNVKSIIFRLWNDNMLCSQNFNNWRKLGCIKLFLGNPFENLYKYSPVFLYYSRFYVEFTISTRCNIIYLRCNTHLHYVNFNQKIYL